VKIANGRKTTKCVKKTAFFENEVIATWESEAD